MTRKFCLALALLGALHLSAQIQVSKLIGKNSSGFKLGWGGFLKMGYPVSDAADVNLEVGVNFFQDKDYPEYGWATLPVKLGYRYAFGEDGTGFYVQPQAGYNVYGVDPDDNKFTGLILAGGVGWLFRPSGKVQFDIGILYETAFHKGGSANYVSLRLAHNFVLGRRDRD